MIIQSNKRYLYFLYLVVVCWILPIIFLFASVGAITPIAQSYITESKLSIGSIVSLKENSSDEVVAAKSSNSENLLGVVINPDSAMLSISGGGGKQVQVATSGTLQVLASDINGDIKKGDYITASPISGVGMKATNNVRAIGIAQNSLTGGSQEYYKDAEGVQHKVILGEITILINVSDFYKEPNKTVIPSALQQVANALAGKSVSTLPIVISSIIFIVMVIIVSSIIFSMIRSSIISIGRNPLSQSAVYRDIVQLSLLVMAILAVGMTSIYLVLTRM